MFIYFPQQGSRTMTSHTILHATTVDDVGRYVPKICETLDNKQVEHQSHMIEV